MGDEEKMTEKRLATPTEIMLMELDKLFKYHKPTGDQPQRYENINDAAKHFAKVVLANCPECADRTHSIRVIRDARMWANCSIACNEVLS